MLVKNFTDFFRRELKMYSIGDIKFKNPIPLKRVAYTFLFMFLYSLPTFLFFYNVLQMDPTSVWLYIITVAPAFAGGYFATRPVFGGKTLIDWGMTSINFLFKEPKSWTDFVGRNEKDEGVYNIRNEIWISRRRELGILAKMRMHSNPANHPHLEPDRVLPSLKVLDAETLERITPTKDITFFSEDGDDIYLIGEEWFANMCFWCGDHFGDNVLFYKIPPGLRMCEDCYLKQTPED